MREAVIILTGKYIKGIRFWTTFITGMTNNDFQNYFILCPSNSWSFLMELLLLLKI
jgi:hypothetical protein